MSTSSGSSSGGQKGYPTPKTKLSKGDTSNTPTQAARCETRPDLTLGTDSPFVQNTAASSAAQSTINIEDDLNTRDTHTIPGTTSSTSLSRSVPDTFRDIQTTNRSSTDKSRSSGSPSSGNSDSDKGLK